MGFDDLCEDQSHKAVHYDEHGYMKCDRDKKYIPADGRTVTFTKPRDRKRYELMKRRLRVIFGSG